MENIVTGVDIGGTHITVGLVDLNKAELIISSLVRMHVDPYGNAAAIIHAWTNAITTCHQQENRNIERIGIAMPGPFDYKNGISFIKGLHKFESLYGLNTKELLAAELKIAPEQLRMINDASAFLLGEMYGGCGKGYHNLAGITLGTGLGSAAFYNNTEEEGDLYCMAYKDGMAEDYLCSRWFVNEYERLTQKKIKGVKEIAAIASQDIDAKELFKQFGYSLAEVLIKRYQVQSPEVIVIGGNIAKAWNHFIPFTQQAMEQHQCLFYLRQAVLGEEAALIGASYIWKKE